MTKTPTHTEIFKSLHIKGNPLVLCNIWDAGTAKIVADAGAKAIATGSWAVAAANGYGDGEALPFETVLHNLRLAVKAVNVPVSIDLESGYGQKPEQVADTASRAVEMGAAGFNLEDQITGGASKGQSLYDIHEQAARIAASRAGADRVVDGVFINARTDVFLQAGPDAPIDDLLNEVMQRAQAYHQAGADGLFVPGLVDAAAIKTLCAATPLPVNIMMLPDCPDIDTLAKLGVARISHGPGPYQAAMAIIAAQAKTLYS